MRALDFSRTPSQWLIAAGVEALEVAQILRSFQGIPQVFRYSAPQLFLRAHGKATRAPIFAPNYWMDASALASAYSRAGQFCGFLTDDEIREIAKNYYREIAAVSYGWNGLASNSFWRIDLRGGETVEGLAGFAAPQPTHSADLRTGASASISTFSGGGMQVFLDPKTPFICSPVNW